MPDGFIGLNPYEAKARIDEFNEKATMAQRNYVEKTTRYFNGLSKVWFSDKGVTYQNLIESKINDLDNELIYFIKSVVNDACEAYNSLASVNGAPTIFISEGPFLSSSHENLLPTSTDGNTGMKVEEVVRLTDDYLSDLEYLKSEISSLPRDIAFYDNDGALASSFNTRINELCDKVDESVNLIKTNIQVDVEDNTNDVEQGSATAQEILSRN